MIFKKNFFSFFNFLYFKLNIYFELLKFRLSLLVSLSSGFGYGLSLNQCNCKWINFFLFFLGGFLISSSSIILNQILEKNYDKFMFRTNNRPLPKNKISILESFFFSIFILIFGSILLLYYTNFLTFCLSLLSLFLYTFIYTPLKRFSPFSVLIGAFPGALPPLIGWSASTNIISYESLIIFGVQFIWQFPHFWSIAWIANNDYNFSGFKLLPKNSKNINTTIHIVMYIIFLIFFSFLPLKFQIINNNFIFFVFVIGIFFLFQSFFLILDFSKKSALKVMFASFFYLPVIQILYLLDKI